MKLLRVRDALCRARQIVYVDSEAHPKPNRDTNSIHAVFAGYAEARTANFLGLVTEKEIARFPHRIFGDLVKPGTPPAVSADTLLSKLQKSLDAMEWLLVPVVDRLGQFIGAVTQESMLSALLRREKTLLTESRLMNALLEKDRAQLSAWSHRLYDLQDASRELMGLLSHTTLHTELLQVGIESLAKLLNARYGAIALLDEPGGTLSQFIHTGMSAEQVAKMDHYPEGKGLLGVVIDTNACLRLDHLGDDPRSGGFPPHHPVMRSLLVVAVSHLGPFHGRIYLCDKLDGKSFTADDEALALNFARSLSLVLDNAHEIEETRCAKQHLAVMAHYDGLTGLPNRELLFDRLEQAIIYGRCNRSFISLLFLDIDNFKLVNDTLGHPTGDLLLKTIAERLSTCVRDGDTIARLGGDEFVFMLPGLYDAQDATIIAQKVQAALAQPIPLGGQSTVVSASIGIALYPSDGTDIEELLKKADMAMYHAKAQGRNNFQFFTEAMNVNAHRRVMLETHLRLALDVGEMHLFYQPQFDIASRRLLGMEALLRWNSAKLGPMPPDQFIPLAEETGLILPIGAWVLRTACAQAKDWLDRGLPLQRMAVNISARQFVQQDFFATVRQILDETRLPATKLEMEITETVLMHSTEATITLLLALSGLGVHFSIDDFGTGYSSLSYLKRFPIGTLKIDQSFVRDIVTDSSDAAIVTAIIAMAESLNLDTVAEGVESEEQLQFLLARRCHCAQGYLLGRPMPAEEIERLFLN